MNKLNLPKGDVTFNIWKALQRIGFGLIALWIIFSSYAGVMTIREFTETHEFVGFEVKLISPISAMESEWEK